jgi:hypothetical protein
MGERSEKTCQLRITINLRNPFHQRVESRDLYRPFPAGASEERFHQASTKRPHAFQTHPRTLYPPFERSFGQLPNAFRTLNRRLRDA